MAEGKLPPEMPQDSSAATCVRKLKKTDGLINWDWPSIEIERRVRAYNPWPGCRRAQWAVSWSTGLEL